VVEGKLNRETAEEKAIENRKKILLSTVFRKSVQMILRNKKKQQTDFTFVKDLLDGVSGIQLEDDNVEKMFWLGRSSEEKARPLLVSFKQGRN